MLRDTDGGRNQRVIGPELLAPRPDFSTLANFGEITSVFAAVSNRAMVTTSSPLGHSTTTFTSRNALVSAMTFSAVFAAESDSTLLAVATASWTLEHLGAHAKPRNPCRMNSSST